MPGALKCPKSVSYSMIVWDPLGSEWWLKPYESMGWPRESCV